MQGPDYCPKCGADFYPELGCYCNRIINEGTRVSLTGKHIPETRSVTEAEYLDYGHAIEAL